MKFSIITWDASFRESYHTIYFFGRQNYPTSKFEFFWCEYYNNNNKKLLDKIKSYPNFHLLNLNRPKEEKWHLGKAINFGIKHSQGEILVIPDGDIVVTPDFLSYVAKIYDTASRDLVLYFRRWDEPQKYHSEKSYEIEYLQKVCRLNNLTNYGGCLVIRKDIFEEIGFYEEHPIFSGPGANGLEQYKRFRNKGLAIKWADLPIYHPYHPLTGNSDKISQKLIQASKRQTWIVPYMGLEQSWIIKKRDENLDWKANDGSIDKYLDELNKIKDKILNVNNCNLREILSEIKKCFLN